MRRTLLLCLPLLLLAAACGASGEVAEGPDLAGASERTATRDDVDCSPDAIGEDDESTFEVVHVVVDGQLGAPCLGEEDPVLLEAWEDLATITPPAQLTDLALFGGFVGPDGDEGDEQTLAFVLPIDVDGELFQMAVNLDAYEDDRNEALLTVAHEFAHVFTSLPSELDRSDEAFETCETYLGASGCFVEGSLIDAWVLEFWPDDLLADLDPDVAPSAEGGEDRCERDPGFLGPYAASDPEEDFAESFSAYVFDLEVETPELQAKLDWLAGQPGLAEFRERADAAGLTPLENAFEPCG